MNEVGEASYNFTHLELCKEDFENLMLLNTFTVQPTEY